MVKDDHFRHLNEVCQVAILIERQKTTNLNQNIAILENAISSSDIEIVRRSLANSIKHLRNFSEIFGDEFNRIANESKGFLYFCMNIRRNKDTGELRLCASKDCIGNEDVLVSEMWSSIFEAVGNEKFVFNVWLHEYIKLTTE